MISFHYSLWKPSQTGSAIDLGCVDAGIEQVRLDFFFYEVPIGSVTSICSAFGNQDGTTTEAELGSFFEDVQPLLFTSVVVSLLSPEGSPIQFSVLQNSQTVSAANHQRIDFPIEISLQVNEETRLEMPGDPSMQVLQELQILLAE